MGISIYYNVKRAYPLWKEENSLMEAIVEKYEAEKEERFEGWEDFCVYEYDTDEPEEIIAGATGLVMSFADPMLTAECCIFWAKCLTEIRNIIKGAEWSVQMDEDELIWDEEKGWHLPGLKWDDSKGWQLP